MSRELIERYKRLYAGVIYDTLYFDLAYWKPFVIDRAIEQLAGPCDTLVGPAFTCWGTTVNGADPSTVDKARLDVFDAIPFGSVVMIQTGHDSQVAHFGDISALLAKRAGATGVIIDGYTRDLQRIDQMHFSLFARGRQPMDAYGWWYLAGHSASIVLSARGGQNIVVEPGDMIFADRDGVLVIPQRLATDVLVAAEKRAKAEDDIRAAINAGESPMDIYRRLGRW